jgi:uncharacterized protein (DUF885 family)
MRKNMQTARYRRMSLALASLATLATLSCGGSPPAVTDPVHPTASAPTTSASTAQAAPAPAADTQDDAAIADAAKAYLDLIVEISPEAATTLGIHTRDADLDDRTLEGFEKNTAREEKMLAELTTRFKNPRASRAARTDLAILTHTLAVDVRLRREQKPNVLQPDSFATGPMNAIFMMTAREYAPAPERAKNVLARLEKIPKLLEVARTTVKNPPKVWTQVGIDAAGNASSFFDEQKAPLEAALPGAADKARIAAALKGAKDAYAAYTKFLTKEVLPASNGNFAAGKDLFEFLLHENYFLQEDSKAIEETGKRLLTRTIADLDETAKRIDPKTAAASGWSGVVEKVKGHHPKASELLASYRGEVERARKFLVDKDAVAFPAGDDCSVIDTPIFLRSTVGSAAYDQPPPFDAVTKGFFFVTPVDLKLSAKKQEEMLRESDHGDQVDTAVHEAYPGHHLQLSFARTHTSSIRKATGPAIFAEGWALYSEELMSELGYYTDEERLMQLEWTLVRAARVVIDVGLHTHGMTFDEAVKILTDDVHLGRQLALSEVRRYSMNPTQPLAYLIGREQIFALRERYKAREKDKFTLKRFHTEVLSHGTIAPGLIEREIFTD